MTEERRKNNKYEPREKVLLVEGAAEERFIPELMEKNGVAWPTDWKLAPVQMRDKNGYTNLVQRRLINAEINEPIRRITGILLDADDHPKDRWTAIRDCCLQHFPGLIDCQFGESIIVTNPESKKKLGIWIMPDNRSPGMLESLLQSMVPAGDGQKLLAFATHSVTKARDEFKAAFKHSHFDKAVTHTWLAWQDEPGVQFHDAVKRPILDPKSTAAAPFVKWFRNLFEV